MVTKARTSANAGDNLSAGRDPATGSAQYEFEIRKRSAILFHADNVEAADELEAWRKDPDNKKSSVPGDDRSPAWTWQKYLYFDPDGLLAVPAENLMVALRSAAAKIPMKRQETFKRVSQSGLMVTGPRHVEFCEFIGPKGPVREADIGALRGLRFREQAEAVQDLGFKLFVKRAVVGSAKHVRVRARFDEWAVRGVATVTDPIITPEVLGRMFAIAGQQVGLLDWRPAAPKSPGPYGRFTCDLRAA